MPDAITTVALQSAILMRLLFPLHHSADWRHMLEYCTAAARADWMEQLPLTASHIFPIRECSVARRPRDDDACVHTAVSRALISCVTRITSHAWLLHGKPRTPSHAPTLPTLQSEHNNKTCMLAGLNRLCGCRQRSLGQKLALSLLLLLSLLAWCGIW